MEMTYRTTRKEDNQQTSFTDLYNGAKNMYALSTQVVSNTTVMSYIASYLFGSNVVILYSLSSKAYEWYNSWYAPKYTLD